MWLSKTHSSVEMSTFISEFTALKLAVELVIALQYKMHMFGVPLEGANDMFCDKNEVLKNTYTPESMLHKKHHSIAYNKLREDVDALICCIAKEDTDTNLADLFTNILGRTRREWLLDLVTH